jgi:hypothetical protein
LTGSPTACADGAHVAAAIAASTIAHIKLRMTDEMRGIPTIQNSQSRATRPVAKGFVAGRTVGTIVAPIGKSRVSESQKWAVADAQIIQSTPACGVLLLS